MLQISQLFIYPVKSLGGISLPTATVTDRGLKHDRRWMLIDENNRFLSQREFAQMALFKVAIENDGLRVSDEHHRSFIHIPFIPQTNIWVKAIVWDDHCDGVLVSKSVDHWFSNALNFTCRLIYMPDNSYRPVDPRYALRQEINSFADGYPFLLIGQASLNDLNSRVDVPLNIDRFRPNLVFTGGDPYQEDEIGHFNVNGIDFYGVKPCARCVMITIDQQNGKKSAEPLKTLAKYRFRKNKILFGQNLLHTGTGNIHVGDAIRLLS